MVRFRVAVLFLSPLILGQSFEVLDRCSAECRPIDDVSEKKRIIFELFQQMVGCEISYELNSPAFCQIYPNNVARFTHTSPTVKNEKDSRFRIIDEVLIQPNDFLISGRQSEFGEDLKKRGKTLLQGELDWRHSKAIYHQLRFIWMGCFWDGQQFVDLKSDTVWRNGELSETDNCLVLTLPSKARFRFDFKAIDEKIVLSRVTIICRYEINSNDQSKPAEVIENFEAAYQFYYSGKMNGLAGWSVVDEAEPNSDVPPLEYKAKIKSITRIKNDPDLPLKFKNVTVRNGSKVHVKGSTFRYEYDDGRVRRVIDKESTDVIDQLLQSRKQNKGEPTSRISVVDGIEADGTTKFVNYLRESSWEPHCGAYALCGAAALLGKCIAISDLIGDEKLSGRKGASVMAIEDTVKKYGLYSKTVNGCDFKALAELDSPALLHFSNALQSEFDSHWVTFCGVTSDGKFRILDLPRPPIDISPAVLLIAWDGTAIFLDDKPISRWKYLLSRKWTLIYVFGFLTSLALIFSQGLAWQHKRRANATSENCLAILIATLFASVVWLNMSAVSYASNPMAVRLTLAKSDPARVEIPTISNPQSGQDCLIVDCRSQASFKAGHLPGAVSLPVGSSIIETAEFCQVFSGFFEKNVVVYCQNAQCEWAKYTANLLMALGFKNVCVYEPGWEVYLQEHGSSEVGW